MSVETVRVSVRLSPPQTEEEQYSERIIELLKDNKLIAYHPESKQGLMYQFDNTFGHDVANVDIYSSCCEDRVRLFLTGYNVCFLSYGPSKTGKTHVFFGTPDEQGIVSLTAKEIFNSAAVGKNDFRYEIYLQFWEMNNTDIVDLLQRRTEQNQRDFKIHKDPQNKEKAIRNLTKKSLESYEHFESVMKYGTIFSQDISTQRGIRWHNFLKITVSRTEINRPQHTVQSSALFINMKGTDRLGQYGANKFLVKEGASINRSITAFGNTVHNLVSFCRKRFRKGENLPRNVTKLRRSLQRETHSMFGDSKMTLMLSDIFVGNYYTTIICSISGSEFHYLETVDALENLRIANHIPVFPEKGVVRNTDIYRVHREIRKIERNLEKDPLAPGHPPTEQQERLFELRKEFVLLCEEEGLSAAYIDSEDEDEYEQQQQEEEDERRRGRRSGRKKSQKKKIKKSSYGETSVRLGFEFGKFPDESERSKQTFFMPKKKKRKRKKVGSIAMFKELTRKVESLDGGGDAALHQHSSKSRKRKKLYQYVYEGSWENGNKNGFGNIETKRYRYEGFWKDNKKHGRIGVLSVKEEVKVPIKNPKTMLSKKFRMKTVYRRVYKGEWKYGKKDGRGIYYFKNGEMYIGEWAADKKHGNGIMYKLDGSKHTGEYAYDMKSGYGVTEYKNGNLFRGYFSKDKKHGPGIYFYRDQNQVYKGEWSDGVPKCGEIGYLEEVMPGKEEPVHVLNRLPLPVSELDNRVALINEAVVSTRKSIRSVHVKGIINIKKKKKKEEEEEEEEEELKIQKELKRRRRRKVGGGIGRKRSSISKRRGSSDIIPPVFEKEMDFLVDDFERLLFPHGRESYEKAYKERLRKIRLIEERRRRKAGEIVKKEEDEGMERENVQKKHEEEIGEEEDDDDDDDDEEEEEEGELDEEYMDLRDGDLEDSEEDEGEYIPGGVNDEVLMDGEYGGEREEYDEEEGEEYDEEEGEEYQGEYSEEEEEEGEPYYVE